MSLSFFDGTTIKNIRKNILKLNLDVTYDAQSIGQGQSVFTDRNTFVTVNQSDPSIVDEPRPSDLQEPLSISLLRKNKYGSTAEGYRLVSIEENPREFLGNEEKLEYDDLVQPYIGDPITDGPSKIIDIKTLILNNQISSYRDTPIGLIGIRALDNLIKENIAANVESATVGRFNSDPLSLLKGNSLILADRTITKANPTLGNPISFLQAGVNTTNEYLGYTIPVSPIPNAAFGIQTDNSDFARNKRNLIENGGGNKFANFLNGVSKVISNPLNAITNLGGGFINDITTEARMEDLYNYTGDGQKELIYNNLSQNVYQPGYSYRQSLLKNKTLANFQSNTIKKSLVNRGSKSVYGLLNNTERYKKLGVKGAYDLGKNNSELSVLKSNGMVRIAPDKDKPDVKSFMFSIENLAWADVPNAFMAKSELGVGDPSSGLRGKMMWFPPYDLTVTDNSTANWDSQDFIGRPEPVYTYNNSSRDGTLSFKVIVDHPSIINVARGSQSNVLEKYFSGEIKIENLDPAASNSKNEDQKRSLFKKLFGNKKKPNLSVGDSLTGSLNSPNIPGASNLLGGLSAASTPNTKEEKEISSFWADTENTWFSELGEDQEYIFKYLAEKIQYFSPAFHSMSPEGFNGRLTFLQQCLRQGPSISEGGKSPAGNLAFGRPPICILRIGDFYNTKVAFDSLTISYDEGNWDLNPDGIGVQPMIATVSMGFKYIGGSSLTGPINRLQNAISFNYYANTEIYESRSNYWATEKVTSKDPISGKDVTTEQIILKSGLDVNTISNVELQKDSLGESVKTSNSGDQVNSQNNDQIASSGGQNFKSTPFF